MTPVSVRVARWRALFLALLALTVGGCGRDTTTDQTSATEPHATTGAATTTAATGTAAATPRGAPPPRWKKVRMTDTQLFGAETTLLDMMIPVDWRWEAALAVRANELAGCPENAFGGHFEATSPDGRFALAGLPPLTTVHFRLPALKMDADRRRQMGQTFCVEAPRMSLPEFVERLLIPAFRRGARVTGYNALPALTARVTAQLRQMQFPNLRSEGEVGVVTIAFQVNGQDVEEQIYLQGVWNIQDAPCTPEQRAQEAMYRQMHAQNGMPPPPTLCSDGQGSQVNSTYTPLLIRRTPAGHAGEDARRFADMAASLQLNQRAMLAIVQSVTQMRRAIFDGMIGQIRDTSRIVRDAANSISERQLRETEAKRSESLDIAGLWSDTVLETEDYRDRNGETVRLSNHYNHVYSNGNGEYVFSNDPSDHPAVALGQDWQAIAPVGRRGGQ